jgi:hypothetical protein
MALEEASGLGLFEVYLRDFFPFLEGEEGLMFLFWRLDKVGLLDRGLDYGGERDLCLDCLEFSLGLIGL